MKAAYKIETCKHLRKKKLTSTLAVSSSSQECPFPGQVVVINMTTNFPSSRIKVSVPAFGNRVVWAQNISKIT